MPDSNLDDPGGKFAQLHAELRSLTVPTRLVGSVLLTLNLAFLAMMGGLWRSVAVQDRDTAEVKQSIKDLRTEFGGRLDRIEGYLKKQGP
jgi:hypothetical protein